MKRFVSRRGLPKEIHTDNGTNFQGARNDLSSLYAFLSDAKTTSTISAYRITWRCIPERAPHFGGLWEAAVKSAKFHLKRVIGTRKLDYEEFSTVAAQVESCLNSRPLTSTTSHPVDEITILTLGHFLIGRALRAYLSTVDGSFAKPSPTIFGADGHLSTFSTCRRQGNGGLKAQPPTWRHSSYHQ